MEAAAVRVRELRAIRFSRGVSVLVLLLAVAELAVAAGERSLLSGLVPGTPRMVPLTAAWLLVLAVAAFLRTVPSLRVQHSGRALAASVLVVAVIVFLEYSGLALPWRVELARPAVNTAFATALLAGALLAGSGSRTTTRLTIREGLALAAGGVASAGLTGYAYQLSWMYGLFTGDPATGMALDTAVGLAALSLAVVALCPSCGVMQLLMADGARADVLRRFLPVTVLIPFALAFFLVVGARASSPTLKVVGTLLGLGTPLFVAALVWIGASRIGEIEERLLKSRRDLEIAERRIRLALQNEPRIFVFSQNLDLRYDWFQTANPDFPPEDWLGKTDEDVLGKENATLLQSMKRGVIDTGTVASGEIGVVVHGKPVAYQLTLEPRRDEQGRITGLRGAAIDVTALGELAEERRKLLDAVEVQRARLAEILRQLPEGVIITEVGGRTTLNDAARRYVLGQKQGVDRDGKPIVLEEFRRPDGTTVRIEDLPLTRAMREGSRVSEELVLETKAGPVPLLASAAPIRDANGEDLGGVVVLKDVTALKDLERLREEWTAVVAHDLRQPLSVLALSSGVLDAATRNLELPAQGVQALARIRSATQLLTRMTNDLLDASRIESRRLSLNRRTVDVGEVVEDVVEQFRAGGSVVRMERGTGCIAWGDPDRLGQVLSNLLSNAVKYGTAGAEVVTSVRSVGEEIEVAVTNSGPPLPDEERANLFHRFYRAPSGQHAPGVGLGLYIAKGIVDAHGGRIVLESGGKRTTVRVTLPRHRAEEHLSVT